MNSGWTTNFLFDRKDKKNAREFLEKGKKDINRCILFAKTCLEDKSLTGVQKATLQVAIDRDKELIKQLDDTKPSRCVIM